MDSSKSSSAMNYSSIYDTSPNLKRKRMTKYLLRVSDDESKKLVRINKIALQTSQSIKYDELINLDKEKLNELKEKLFNHITYTMNATLLPL